VCLGFILYVVCEGGKDNGWRSDTDEVRMVSHRYCKSLVHVCFLHVVRKKRNVEKIRIPPCDSGGDTSDNRDGVVGVSQQQLLGPNDHCMVDVLFVRISFQSYISGEIHCPDAIRMTRVPNPRNI
jgi:hypothetical protein